MEGKQENTPAATASPKKPFAQKVWGRLLVNLCRFAVALVFIFSGFVKAVDPLGTQYKINDYLTALNLNGLVSDWVTLGMSVGLSAVEFCLGVFLLFAIHRRTSSKVALALMVVMTIVAIWLWEENPIADCGCFGDAVHLTNGQTLLKNLVLLAFTAIIAWQPLVLVRFISKTNQWIVMYVTVLFILVVSAWCLYYLPIFDFRPYHVGANIVKGMEIPEGAKSPEFVTTFIMEKNGQRKEFTEENYPDSTWTFVDSKTVQTDVGYVPPIHDFSIERMDTGEDITQEVLHDTGYTFLLISPHLELASDSNFGEIDMLYEYAADHGYPFYGLTASGQDAVDRWRDLTGAEYPFCFTDETTLKTIVRSNPGMLLLKNGTIIQKWSHNDLPVIAQQDTRQPLEKLAIGRLGDDSVPKKLSIIMMWYVLPLAILTMGDRLWAGGQWLYRRNKRRGKAAAKQAEDPSE